MNNKSLYLKINHLNKSKHKSKPINIQIIIMYKSNKLNNKKNQMLTKIKIRKKRKIDYIIFKPCLLLLIFYKYFKVRHIFNSSYQNNYV
jgi:uncharacterized membrane protein YobD (UPF0266 family)